MAPTAQVVWQCFYCHTRVYPDDHPRWIHLNKDVRTVHPWCNGRITTVMRIIIRRYLDMGPADTVADVADLAHEIHDGLFGCDDDFCGYEPIA